MLVADRDGEGQRKHEWMRLRTRDSGPVRCSLFAKVEDDGHTVGLQSAIMVVM